MVVRAREVDDLSEDAPLLVRQWPQPPAEAAYSGLVGEIVTTIDPHTEADPVAVLTGLLAMIGNAVNRGAHFRVGATSHHLNLFVLQVGNTASGRKGTALEEARRIMRGADDGWELRITSGLSTGEGLIWNVRDPIEKLEPIRESGRIVRHDSVTSDPGEPDKRLMVLESEFAGVLKVASRESNTLSPILRQAWDGGLLRTMAKNSPARATDAHISMIGQITVDELRRTLAAGDIANGLVNRYLPVCVRRSKVLPHGGSLSDSALVPLQYRLRDVLDHGRRVGEMARDAAANRLWSDVYPELTAERGGMLGAVTARAAAQVLRLQCLYAVIDRSNVVRVEHIQSALALWDFVQRSAEHLFGDFLGDPVSDALLRELRQAGAQGMTRTMIRDAFGRNQPAANISDALRRLAAQGLVHSAKHSTTGGRPAEIWFATITPSAADLRSVPSFMSCQQGSKGNGNGNGNRYDKNDISLISPRPLSLGRHDQNDRNDESEEDRLERDAIQAEAAG